MAVGDGGAASRAGAAAGLGLGLARAICLGCGEDFLTGLVFSGGVGCLIAAGGGALRTKVTSSGSCEEFACTLIFCRLGRKTTNSNT